MIKSYTLKMYPNKSKEKELNKLISFYRDHINHKIKVFWNMDIDDFYPPKEYTIGGRIIRDASMKAWQIVKGAKKTNQKQRPLFDGYEIDLNELSGYIIPDLKTKEFDLWLNVISLIPRKRLKLPCKKYDKFNESLNNGTLKKSMKIIKKNNEYYVQLYIEIPELLSNNKQLLGVDVGLNNTVVTSDRTVFGNDLKELRIRTKWRTYHRLSSFKQGLNRTTKQIINIYPNTDFAVEQLLFKGKRKRSTTFRRRNNNWAYTHLSQQLEMYGNLKGFRVHKINPAYTSTTGPVCGFMSAMNRICSDTFKCGQCGFSDDADHVGAWNIVERVMRNIRSDTKIIGDIFL